MYTYHPHTYVHYFPSYLMYIHHIHILYMYIYSYHICFQLYIFISHTYIIDTCLPFISFIMQYESYTSSCIAHTVSQSCITYICCPFIMGHVLVSTANRYLNVSLIYIYQFLLNIIYLFILNAPYMSYIQTMNKDNGLLVIITYITLLYWNKAL